MTFASSSKCSGSILALLHRAWYLCAKEPPPENIRMKEPSPLHRLNKDNEEWSQSFHFWRQMTLRIMFVSHCMHVRTAMEMMCRLRSIGSLLLSLPELWQPLGSIDISRIHPLGREERASRHCTKEPPVLSATASSKTPLSDMESSEGKPSDSSCSTSIVGGNDHYRELRLQDAATVSCEGTTECFATAEGFVDRPPHSYYSGGRSRRLAGIPSIRQRVAAAAPGALCEHHCSDEC